MDKAGYRKTVASAPWRKSQRRRLPQRALGPARKSSGCCDSEKRYAPPDPAFAPIQPVTALGLSEASSLSTHNTTVRNIGSRGNVDTVQSDGYGNGFKPLRMELVEGYDKANSPVASHG